MLQVVDSRGRCRGGERARVDDAARSLDRVQGVVNGYGFLVR